MSLEHSTIADGKNIFNTGGKAMQKAKDFCVDENGWIHCPECRCRTRTKIKRETVLINFPIYCPKCKNECMIDVNNMKIKLSVEPILIS